MRGIELRGEVIQCDDGPFASALREERRLGKHTCQRGELFLATRQVFAQRSAFKGQGPVGAMDTKRRVTTGDISATLRAQFFRELTSLPQPRL